MKKKDIIDLIVSFILVLIPLTIGAVLCYAIMFHLLILVKLVLIVLFSIAVVILTDILLIQRE